MAYDRYDSREDSRGDRNRGRNERGSRERYFDDGRSQDRSGRHDDRGFFERASDEVASWFGDEEAERRRRRDQEMDSRSEQGSRGARGDMSRDYGRGEDRDRNFNQRSSSDWNTDQSAFSQGVRGQQTYNRGRDDDRSRGRGGADWNDNRGMFARGGSSERDYDPSWRDDYSGREFDRSQADRQMDRGWRDRYQPMAGDYGRSGRSPADRGDDARSQSKWAQDEYRGTSRAGSANWSDRSREDSSQQGRHPDFDHHYNSWRDRHLEELDRDYNDFRAEHRSRFESDFGSWREQRQHKRGLLGQIREHMDVVGSDDKHVGTVDKTAGDRLILTKSDPDSGGMHHSISCSDIARVEDGRVILNCTADQAHERLRDESRGRALFEQDHQGEMGPRVLDRSFGGTYRDR